MITDEIKNKIHSLSDSDLINMIANGKNYRKEALLFAQSEIKNRCINEEQYNKEISKLNVERERKDKKTIEDLTVEEKIKKGYISSLSLLIGILVAFLLYNIFVLEGLKVFSFEDKRILDYEKPYFNFMLLVLSTFTAIGGIVCGLVGLFSLVRTNHNNNKQI